jgi:hypothetical protein
LSLRVYYRYVDVIAGLTRNPGSYGSRIKSGMTAVLSWPEPMAVIAGLTRNPCRLKP